MCCHLYRDNHGSDSVSKELRERHKVGELVKTEDEGDERLERIVNSFSNVWNGDDYSRKRGELTRISPEVRGFSPCGECTRYCQHNITLNAIYQSHRDDRRILDGIGETDLPVSI